MAETTHKTGFLGQAVLMLLPVAMLLAVGLYSLRLDRILAHREATDRAQRLAEALLAETATALTAPVASRESRARTFQVDSDGQLLAPPVAPALRPRPLLLSALSPEQARLWRQAQQAEGQGNGLEAGIAAYRAFLALHPPPDFTANAAYALGLLLARVGQVSEAVGHCQTLLESQPEAVAESGLPLQPLARLKLLEWQTNTAPAGRLALLEALGADLVQHPTLLTPALLREAGRCSDSPAAEAKLRAWTGLWQEQQRARTLYAAAWGAWTNSPGRTTRSASTDDPTGLARAPRLAPEGEGSMTGAPGPASTDAQDAALFSAGGSAPRAFWFREPAPASNGDAAGAEDTQWLAVRCQPSATDGWYWCQTETEVNASISAVVARPAAVPDYLGVELRIAGRPVVVPAATRPREGVAPEPLGVAQRSEQGADWLQVRVFLTQPGLLYTYQRTRRFWFGSLIAISAAAALTGLWTNWRAFQRQQRLSELKSNFVSSVSHELRTPVASIRALVDGLESGRVTGPWKQQQYLRLVSQECGRLSALIENILDFSRIEQGRKQFEFEPTDVLALAEQTVRMIEPYAAEREVSVSLAAPVHAASGGPWPVLDGRAIQQALLNLIDNAVKHSPAHQTVSVGIDWAGNQRQEPGWNGAPAGELALWVEDRGNGIPPAEHEKIFERFYRCGSELHRETAGVGIGLSIVKHIVEAHGGRVLVRSAVGQGSRFIIQLPLRGPAPSNPA